MPVEIATTYPFSGATDTYTVWTPENMSPDEQLAYAIEKRFPAHNLRINADDLEWGRDEDGGPLERF